MTGISRCGYAAIIGRPNVGKSTLLNTLIGKKISIISPKPQTTRNQILGIKIIDNTQIIFIDTPGMHDAEKRAINRYMNRLASSVLVDADVVIFMIEATRFTKDDEMILNKIKEANARTVLVINKIDQLNDKKEILPLIQKFNDMHAFESIIPISARRDENIDGLQNTIAKMLPEGAHLFPDDQITDKNASFQVAEIIREQLIRATEQELPYSTTVVIESFKEEKKLLEISAIIWVEREGQKPIVIGKNGERLKSIGTAARKEMVKLLGRKIFLRLWVKVKDDWTDNEKALSSLGLN